MTTSNWKLIEWDGNHELGYKCWRKKFGRGHVSVGAGKFLSVAFSYGPDSDDSYSSTRWDYDRPVITEEEAMQMVDAGGGKEMAGRQPSPPSGARSMSNSPTTLFHVTTGRKAKQYRQTGQIIGPVRGFDTITGAMAWAMKTGRKVVMEVYPVSPPHKLPDHHNAFGDAWWTDSVPMGRVKCAYSAEGAWDQPDKTTE